jgi:fluoroquinolone resistance protein
LPGGILPETKYDGRKFEKEDLSGKHLAASEFTDSTFLRCKFDESHFEDCRFTACIFDECDLSLVRLTGSTFSSVTFENSRAIGVDWTRAAWPSLGSAQIAFLRSSISHSTFIGLSLQEIRFIDCTAIDVDFREADLSRALFTNTDLAESIFLNTILTQADLSRARNYYIDPGQNKISQARFSLPEALSLLYCMDIDLVDPS